MSITDEERASTIAALIRERAGYEQHGKTDRVAEVDAQLTRLGERAAAPAKRAQTRKAKSE